MKTLFALFLSIGICQAFDFTTVNIGVTNNDGTGDTLRTAFGKINTNFYYLTNSAPTITSTNWVSGQLYTNLTSRPWFVQTTAVTTYTTVAGAAVQRLQTADQGSALATIAQFGSQTIIGTLATTNSGIVCGAIPAGNYFSFSNLVAGAGDTAINLPGTGFWIEY